MYAQKGNCVYQISDAEVERYVNLGYDIYSNAHNVIKKADVNNIDELKRTIATKDDEIKELKDVIIGLNAKISELEVANDKLQADLAVASQPKPARKSRKTSLVTDETVTE